MLNKYNKQNKSQGFLPGFMLASNYLAFFFCVTLEEVT